MAINPLIILLFIIVTSTIHVSTQYDIINTVTQYRRGNKVLLFDLIL